VPRYNKEPETLSETSNLVFHSEIMLTNRYNNQFNYQEILI